MESLLDPNNESIMDDEDGDFACSPAPCQLQFLNLPSPIRGPDPRTHNPRYHFLRYGLGRSDAELQQAGVVPGTYDTDGFYEFFRLRFRTIFGASAEGSFGGLASTGTLDTIYDVRVLVTDGGEAASLVLEIPVTTVDGLDGIEIEAPPGGAVTILAASTPGGPYDIILATGDPFAPENQQVSQGQLAASGNLGASLYWIGASGETLDSAPVDIELVASPVPTLTPGALSILLALMLGVGGFVARRLPS